MSHIIINAKAHLYECYLITGMLCLFSDGGVIPRAGGVSLSLDDNC